MSFLFSISEVHLVSVVTQWLQWQDLGKLDSALCHRKTRSVFRSALLSSNCLFETSIQPLYSQRNRIPSLNWIVRRRLRVRTIKIFGAQIQDNRVRFNILRSLGPSLDTLEIDMSGIDTARRAFYNIFEDIIAHAPLVKHLELTSPPHRLKSVDSFYARLCACIPRLPALQTLVVIQVEEMDDQLMKVICSAAHLRTVEFRFCTLKPSAAQCGVTGPHITSFEWCNCHCADGNMLCLLFPNLIRLHCADVTASEVKIIVSQCPHLVDINLHLSHGAISERTAMSMANKWPSLDKLQIGRSGSYIKEDITLVLIKYCTKLTSFCSNMSTPEDVEVVMYPHQYTGSRLRTVCIDCMYASTLCTIVSNCPFLHTLALHAPLHRKGFSSQPGVMTALDCLVSSSVRELQLHNYPAAPEQMLLLQHAQLTHLELYDLRAITDACLLALAPTLLRLTSLYLEDCYSMTYNFPVMLPHLCPSLRSFHFVTLDSRDDESDAHLLVEKCMRRLYPHVLYWNIVC